MKVYISFGKILVVVLCKNPQMTIKDLQDKAVKRYKTIIKRGPEYEVVVTNLAYASTGAILNEDDEVEDFIEDQEKLIAIYEEPEVEPFQGSLKKFITDFQEISMDDRIESLSGSDRSSISQKQQYNQLRSMSLTPNLHQYQDEDTFSTNTNSSSLLHNNPFMRKNPQYQSIVNRGFTAGKYKDQYSNGYYGDNIVTSYNEQYEFRTPTPQKDIENETVMTSQHQHYNRLNPAVAVGNQRRHGNNVNNNNVKELPVYDFRKKSRSSSLASQSLPWFYRKSKRVSIRNDDGKPLGLQLMQYDDPESGDFCGLQIKSIERSGNFNKDVSSIFNCGDVIVEINGRILINYSYEKACNVLQDLGSNTGRQINFRILPAASNNNCYEERSEAEGNVEEFNYDVKNNIKPHKISSMSSLSNDYQYYGETQTKEMENKPVPPPRGASVQAVTNLQHKIQQNYIDTRNNNAISNHHEKISIHKNKIDVRNAQKIDSGTTEILKNISTYSRKIGKKIKVQLLKDSTGLGFSVTSRDTLVGGLNSPIYIKNILGSGSAVRDGRLKIGDRLLEINGTELSQHTQRDVVNILRSIKTGDKVDLLISRQHDFIPRKMKTDEIESLNSSVEKSSLKENLEFDIQLNDTGSAGLGISVKGNQNRKTGKGQGIFIKNILHGGAVWQDGRLEVNDQLIEVNGNSLLGISNEQALNVLKTCMMIENSSVIQVVVTRRSNMNTTNLSSNFDNKSMGSSLEYIHTSSENNISSNEELHDINDDAESAISRFNRDSIYRQSVSEKRRINRSGGDGSSGRFIINSNNSSQRKYPISVSSLQAEEEKDKFKKSNSLESLGKIINPNRIEKSNYGMKKKLSNSMENLLSEKPTSLIGKPVARSYTPHKFMNESFKAAIDQSSVSSVSKESHTSSTIFQMRKPKHVKRNNENKKHRNREQTPHKPQVRSSSQGRSTARKSLTDRLQSCVDAVTPNIRNSGSYDVTVPDGSAKRSSRTLPRRHGNSKDDVSVGKSPNKLNTSHDKIQMRWLKPSKIIQNTENEN